MFPFLSRLLAICATLFTFSFLADFEKFRFLFTLFRIESPSKCCTENPFFSSRFFIFFASVVFPLQGNPVNHTTKYFLFLLFLCVKSYFRFLFINLKIFSTASFGVLAGIAFILLRLSKYLTAI